MPGIRNRIAQRLEPQAWTAKGTIGDSVAYQNRRKASLRKATLVLEALQDPPKSVLDAIERAAPQSPADIRSVWAEIVDAVLSEPEDPT